MVTKERGDPVKEGERTGRGLFSTQSVKRLLDMGFF